MTTPADRDPLATALTKTFTADTCKQLADYLTVGLDSRDPRALLIRRLRDALDTAATPRPVPTTRDRLTDARTCDALCRDIEVERDDLRIQTGRIEADNRAMMRERDEALDDRDILRAEINRVEQTRQEQVQALNAKLQDALWTAGQHATTAASLRQQLDQATAERDQARRLAALTAEQEAANAQIIVDTRAERDRVRDRLAETRFRLTRTEQELGAAGDVLAAVRDAAERIDRALAERDKLVETIGRLISLPPVLVAEAYGVTYTGEVQS